MTFQEIIDETVQGALDPVMARLEPAIGQSAAAAICSAQIKMLAGWLEQLAGPKAAAELLQREAAEIVRRGRLL